MKALYIEPNQEPRVIEFDHQLSTIQRLVGGPIDIIDPFEEDVIIILNDEGKNIGLPPNRTINDRITIHGPFLICGCDESGTTLSLNDDYAQVYAEFFSLQKASKPH